MHIVDSTLFFAPHSGGVKRYLTAKHAFLAARPGVRHTLVVPGPATTSRPEGVVELASPAIPCGGGYRLPLAWRAWRDALVALAPDLVEAGDPYHLAWAALAAADRRGVPAVAFAHSDVSRLLGSRLGGWARAAIDAYLRRLYRRFDLVLAPSAAVARRLAEIGAPRVLVQPLGVDGAVFHPARRDPALRAELGLPPDTRLLVFAGRLAGEKRIPLLKRAFERLGPPYHLLLVGGTERRRLSPRVTVLPYQSNATRLARLLASCDALVHAGEHETFGLVFLEAMACGRPVVGVRSGAVSELVDESVGLLAPPGDAAGLAEALRALYELDLDALGARARARVEARYTWARTLEAQLRHYTELVRPAPAVATAASTLAGSR